jgi:hypothetical protein
MFHESQFQDGTFRYIWKMKRKKWTAQALVTDSLLKIREKKKWQLSLRRYVLERKPSEAYAPYFGLDIENYRKWIELQFTEEVNWDNFGSAWQFDHIVPVAYFDFSNEEDLKLCWNFINIRVEKLELNKNRGNRIDVLAAKPYFQNIYNNTGYSLCKNMIDKIGMIEVSNIISEPYLENFIIKNKEHLEMLGSLNNDEFNRLNQGMSLNDILLERELFRKFG